MLTLLFVDWMMALIKWVLQGRPQQEGIDFPQFQNVFKDGLQYSGTSLILEGTGDREHSLLNSSDYITLASKYGY